MPLQGPDDRRRASHLLNRIAFGPLPGDVDRVLATGTAQYVEEQLHPERIDDSEIDKWDSAFATRSTEAAKLRAEYAAQPRGILNQLAAYKIMRAIHSRRQLSEVMADFWFNHFNIDWSKNEAQFLLTSYDRDVIRHLALGNFGELLLAVARHPAMLVYLDNALSIAPNINENYARELLELHTMGVDGGYTQGDVEQVARCFSGWTINMDTLTFRFDETLHEPGNKTVLGQSVPASGYEEGERVLRILAGHPNTARFIATKLVRRLVADEPPATLVNRVANVFRETQGDIRRMVQNILTSADFFAETAYRSKVKSPFEYVASAVRALGANVRMPPMAVLITDNAVRISTSMRNGMNDIQIARRILDTALRHMRLLIPDVQPYGYLAAHMEEIGQFLYQVEAPPGLPEGDGKRWIQTYTVLNRMRFATQLSGGEVPGIVVGSGPWPASWQEIVNVLTGEALVQSEAGAPTTSDPSELALAIGSPDFQMK